MMLGKIRDVAWRVSVRLRTMYWRRLCLSWGHGTRVLGRVWLGSPEEITIGNGCTLNEGVIINARGRITIGNEVRISSGVIINATGLDYSQPGRREHTKEPVTIEDNVWIGSGAIVNPGVRIGKNSVIGAGSVVTSDIPENSVAVGVPAKVIKTIA